MYIIPIEFALQPADADGSWGDRLLPRTRYFPPDARIDRWLVSSPLSVGTAKVRIVARKLASGRIEFALQPADADGSWGDRLLPRTRYFPPDARIDRWLVSSPLEVRSANWAEPTTTLDTSTAREVLTIFYRSTNGDDWDNNENWLTNKPLSTWYGITTNSKNEITSIDLNCNQLTGTIPKELSQLTSLTELYLDNNQLAGTIPVEFAKLVNLTGLWLFNNQLTGTIPTELSQLRNLIYLALSSNELTGPIPKELGQLTNLTGLWLHKNELAGSIPSELGQLTNLTQLYLDNNQLTGNIPKELGRLTNLTELWLYNNELTGSIPSELGELNNLTDLSLSGNKLMGNIPKELGRLTSLTELWLHNNELAGSIPSELGQLTDLAELYLWGNKLMGPLEAPEGLVAEVGDEQVTLMWGTGSDVSWLITGWEYRIRVAGQHFSQWNTIAGGVDVSTYTVIGLQNRLSYQFEVRAVNQAGVGPAARTDTLIPCRAQGLCGPKYTVPVYFCAPAGRYSQSRMESIVAELDTHVHRFYERESSGLVEVRLTLNGVVSPDTDWNALFDSLFYNERFELSKCELEAINAAGGETQILVLVSMQNRTLGGWARYHIGPAVVALDAWGGHGHGGFYQTVAHELGHSLFGLGHTDDEEIRVVDCSEIEWSLMNSGSDCEDNISRHDKLDYYRITCTQRQQLAWPCTASTPVVAGDIPRSYGQWRSYSFTNFIQEGVIVETIRQNIPGNPDDATLYVACYYSDTKAEWRLLLSIHWGGTAFYAPGYNDEFTMSIRFSDRSLLEVPAIESDNTIFSNIPLWNPDARQVAREIISKDGQDMTWFARDSQGRLFQATFDTTGAAVAVQSVLNFCDSQQ